MLQEVELILSTKGARESCAPIVFSMCSVGCEPTIEPSSVKSQLRAGACKRSFADSTNPKRECGKMNSFEVLTMLNANVKDVRPLPGHFSKAQGTKSERVSTKCFCKLVLKAFLSNFLLIAIVLYLAPGTDLLARSQIPAAGSLEQNVRESHPQEWYYWLEVCQALISNTEATRDMC